ELHRSFAGLSTKTLAARLKKMELHGIIIRVSYRESPPRVEYSLTEMGVELLPVIDAVAAAWNVFAFDDKGSASCSACADQSRVTLTQSVESFNRERQDQGAPVTPAKKKTDVTLL
ncbi:MAG: winged helix-turn-helix transcriptional regulator, partial [Blastocatellia bacterium]